MNDQMFGPPSGLPLSGPAALRTEGSNIVSATTPPSLIELRASRLEANAHGVEEIDQRSRLQRMEDEREDALARVARFLQLHQLSSPEGAERVAAALREDLRIGNNARFSAVDPSQLSYARRILEDPEHARLPLALRCAIAQGLIAHGLYRAEASQSCGLVDNIRKALEKSLEDPTPSTSFLLQVLLDRIEKIGCRELDVLFSLAAHFKKRGIRISENPILPQDSECNPKKSHDGPYIDVFTLNGLSRRSSAISLLLIRACKDPAMTKRNFISGIELALRQVGVQDAYIEVDASNMPYATWGIRYSAVRAVS